MRTKLARAAFIGLVSYLAATPTMARLAADPAMDMLQEPSRVPLASGSIGAPEVTLTEKWHSAQATTQSENISGCRIDSDRCSSPTAARLLKIVERARAYEEFAKLATAAPSSLHRGDKIVIEAPTTPSAEARISLDRGGKIGKYVEKYSALAMSGRRVVIDGSCVSACTLVLGIVPLDRICVTRRSVFGVHEASGVDSQGRPIRSPGSTQFVLDTYPKPLRDWIVKNGGLTAHMKYLSGAQLKAIVPGVCFRSVTTTNDHRTSKLEVGRAPSRESARVSARHVVPEHRAGATRKASTIIVAPAPLPPPSLKRFWTSPCVSSAVPTVWSSFTNRPCSERSVATNVIK